MFLRNTGPFPTEEVRKLVEFASHGVNMKRVCVNVKGSKVSRRGRAYDVVPSISNAPPSAEYLLVLAMSENGDYPRGERYPGKLGDHWPTATINDWREQMVWLAAHEARHVHQFRHGKRISELDCERFAAKALDRFRQSTQNCT